MSRQIGELVRPRLLRQQDRLRPDAPQADTIGVAHRTLPCGTKVVLGYRGDFVRTRVIDRGPFVKRALRARLGPDRRRSPEQLGFEGVDQVRAAAIR